MRSHSKWVADLKGYLGSARTITPITMGHIFAIRTAIRYAFAATSQHGHDFRSIADRVISLLYSNLVAFGEKRTSRYSARITERV
jgi:hypothetical protein